MLVSMAARAALAFALGVAVAGPPVPFSEPTTVEAFMDALEADTTGYYMLWLAAKNPRKAEAFLRAAQKRAPARQSWVVLVSALFDQEAMAARDRPAAARTAVFNHALLYLREWHDLTAEKVKRAPFEKVQAEALLGLKANLALALLEAGQLNASRAYATETLALNTDTHNWNYGNLVHDMNEILGRAALREGKREEAKRAFLAAGATPGSPQLHTFGPHFVLARELLKAGEKDAVLQYLDLVGSFWSRDHAALLAQWKDDIRAGRTPADARWR